MNKERNHSNDFVRHFKWTVNYLIKAAAVIFFACSEAHVYAAPTNADENGINEIYQFFVSSGEERRPNLGAYLWIPPNTPKIRAVMVGMHNGLPIDILKSAPVRAVCRKHGIAQILMTPWAKDIGGVMMKDLFYDISDPERTALYDSYIQRLAEVSGHQELVTAPIVPLAHSAYCSFPFEAAARRPEQCLGAIPIKAGMPNVYKMYGPEGKAKHPKPDLTLRHVPILFVMSNDQETVRWFRYPSGYGHYGRNYRAADRDDNPGTDYEPNAELFGTSWDMTSGHFDMLPRNYQYVADWLDAIAAARLPEKVGEPMKNLTLKDGWLMSPKIPATGDLPEDYPMPAPYLEYKGSRKDAQWYPNEELARAQFELGVSEPRKKIEMFTFLDPDGKPISLEHGRMAVMPNAERLLNGDGLFTLTTHHFTKPPEICTEKGKDHTAHSYTNLLFPGQETLPLSGIPLRFDGGSSAWELVRAEQFKDERGVTETRFTLRIKYNRIAPGAGNNSMNFRVYHEGNEDFAATGRTCQPSIALSGRLKNAVPQAVEFPAIADVPTTVDSIPLNAKSSAGLPVDYFVQNGPGIIRDGAFVPAEIPVGTTRPIEVTIGAYQVGRFEEGGGVKSTSTVYRTFRIMTPEQYKNRSRPEEMNVDKTGTVFADALLWLSAGEKVVVLENKVVYWGDKSKAALQLAPQGDVVWLPKGFNGKPVFRLNGKNTSFSAGIPKGLSGPLSVLIVAATPKEQVFTAQGGVNNRILALSLDGKVDYAGGMTVVVGKNYPETPRLIVERKTAKDSLTNIVIGALCRDTGEPGNFNSTMDVAEILIVPTASEEKAKNHLMEKYKL